MPLSDPPAAANGYRLSPDYWLDYLAYAVLRRPNAERLAEVAALARCVTSWGHVFDTAPAVLLEVRVREVHTYERQRRGGALVEQPQ